MPTYFNSNVFYKNFVTSFSRIFNSIWPYKGTEGCIMHIAVMAQFMS